MAKFTGSAAISGECLWTDPSNEAAIGHTLAIAASTLGCYRPASATQIDLSWTIGPPATVPASVINRIDYFIVERAYGDVMFLDDERTDDGAFTDAESWWNGLECAGMVAAVNDDGAAVSSNPFCKMYDGLAEADETTVDEYFMKRYAIVKNDFAHPAVMSLMDMNLMADTEYSYRLRAVYQVGVSDWSETTMADAAGRLDRADRAGRRDGIHRCGEHAKSRVDTRAERRPLPPHRGGYERSS